MIWELKIFQRNQSSRTRNRGLYLIFGPLTLFYWPKVLEEPRNLDFYLNFQPEVCFLGKKTEIAVLCAQFFFLGPI